MSHPSQQGIEQALIEVRKAYRLLHAYQQSALDVFRYIGTQLGLTYRGGWPWFGGSAPVGGRGRLTDSPWKWLSMMVYDFCFDKVNTKGEKEFGLSIILFSDTGFYLPPGDTVIREATETFAPPEKAGTKVGFLISRSWSGGWSDILETREALATFVQAEGKLPQVLEENGVRGWCIDFTRLSDQPSTDQVIDKLIDFAHSNSYSLDRVAHQKTQE